MWFLTGFPSNAASWLIAIIGPLFSNLLSPPKPAWLSFASVRRESLPTHA